MFNTRGDSSGALELLLQPGDTRDPFERNQEDKFMVRGVGVGTPAKMSIWVKGSAAPVAWAVDWASLQISQDCKMQPQIYYANFNRQWLRRSEEQLTCAVLLASMFGMPCGDMCRAWQHVDWMKPWLRWHSQKA